MYGLLPYLIVAHIRFPSGEANFTHTVPPHQSAFVYITTHSVDISLTRVLPGKYISTIVEYWFPSRVLRYEELIACERTYKMLIVEIGICINQWANAIFFCH